MKEPASSPSNVVFASTWMHQFGTSKLFILAKKKKIGSKYLQLVLTRKDNLVGEGCLGSFHFFSPLTQLCLLFILEKASIKKKTYRGRGVCASVDPKAKCVL